MHLYFAGLFIWWTSTVNPIPFGFLTLYLSAQFDRFFQRGKKPSVCRKGDYLKCNESVNCNKHHPSLSYREFGVIWRSAILWSRPSSPLSSPCLFLHTFSKGCLWFWQAFLSVLFTYIWLVKLQHSRRYSAWVGMKWEEQTLFQQYFGEYLMLFSAH